MVLEEVDVHMQKDETRSFFPHHIEVNSKWIKALHVKSETMSLLKENII
jgi:hypothetical protein